MSTDRTVLACSGGLDSMPSGVAAERALAAL